MKLDTNYILKLNYEEINLKDIAIELVNKDDENNGSGVGIKDGKELSETAFQQFCSFTKIPYAFTKQLRKNGRGHILPYLQKQLSRSASDQVILISNSDHILSITTEDKLHYQGKHSITLDTRLEQLLSAKDSHLEMSRKVFSEGDISYSILFKESQKIENDKEGSSLWKAGFVLKHSVLGNSTPNIGVEFVRLTDLSIIHMPIKVYSYPMEYMSSFDERWEYIASFIQNPPPAPWMGLNNMVTKLVKTTASFREVKEARSKLMKLKIDNEDLDTINRINSDLEWKRITKAYDIKNMSIKPTKSWYAKASTPLSLFKVVNIIAREATCAPNSISENLRQTLLLYGGNVLASSPDLYMQPATIDWSKN